MKKLLPIIKLSVILLCILSFSFTNFLSYLPAILQHNPLAESLKIKEAQAAALTYVGGASGTGTGATYSVSLTSLTGGAGSAAIAGDLVIVVTGWASTADGNPGVTTPTGYTEVYDLYGNDTRDANISVNWKIMGATPDTSVTVSGFNNAANGGATVVQVWRGVDTTTPMDVTAPAGVIGTNGSRPNSPIITPVTTDAVVLSVGLGTGDTTPLTQTAPTGYGNAISAAGTGSTMSIIANIASKAWVSGAEDPAAWTGGETSTSDSWAAGTLALRPLPPAGPDATSYTNGTEAALDFSACASTGCGARVTTGTDQTITVTGTTFGTVSAGSRANCAGSAGTGCIRIANYIIPDANVIAWTDTSVQFRIPSAVTVFGGSGTTCGGADGNGLCVTAAGINDTSGALQFFVFPDITSTSPTPSTGAKEGDTVTISGNRFGSVGGTLVFQNCAGGDVDATPTGANWTDTVLTIVVPSGISDNDDSCDIKITRAAGTGSKTDTSNNAANNLGTFVILPNMTSLSICTNCVTNAARECVSTDTNCNDTDTDGLVMLNGNHFGTSQGANGKVEFTGGFGTVSAPIHTTAEGACTVGDWASAATSICMEVSPSISNSVYTGTITLTRNDLKTNIWTDFRILPRTISNTPTSGAGGDTIQLLGNHFCQSGTCPTSPNRSTSADNVVFGSTQAADGDFQNLTGGAGTCNGAAAAWTHSEICVKVPSGTPVGSQPSKVRSNAGSCPGPTCYESNTKAFTVNSTIPNDPTGLQQYKSNGTTIIAVSAGTNESSVVFKASMSGINPSTLCLQIENALITSGFAGTVTAQEGGGGQEACKSYIGTPVTGIVTISSLSNGASYHWRARIKNNSTAETSNWVSFDPSASQDENPPINPASTDFFIDTAGPVISGVSVINISDIQATIQWTTSESADEQVAYGTTCPTGQASAAATFLALTNKQPASPTGSGASHSQTLSGLTGGTTYQYMVRSSDSLGNVSYDPSTANTCSNFQTSTAVTRIMKTNTFFIQTSMTTTLAAAYPKTFSIVIPESNTLRNNITFKSIMIDISGITVGTGGSGITISPNLNSGGATAHTLADPGSGIAVSWAISYPASSINFDCPGCSSVSNTLDMTITGGGASTIVSAKAVITYFYTP